jgi:regulator of protease activity HflC (stomatin/prohibitin superfamily)
MTGGRLAVLVLIGPTTAIRIVRRYENGVLFRFGRLVGTRAPGLRFIIPFVGVLHRISLRIVTMPIQSQGIITQDNVSVDASAVAYFRVVDAVKAVIAIENVNSAIDQIAQTTLRKVVGRQTLSRPTASTWTSARSSTSPPPNGVSRSPWSSSRTFSCPSA